MTMAIKPTTKKAIPNTIQTTSDCTSSGSVGSTVAVTAGTKVMVISPTVEAGIVEVGEDTSVSWACVGEGCVGDVSVGETRDGKVRDGEASGGEPSEGEASGGEDDCVVGDDEIEVSDGVFSDGVVTDCEVVNVDASDSSV